MYFSKFPKIYYDFDKFGDGQRTLHILTDITLNVRVRKQILETITLYDEYDILEGETPEIIAEKIYGDPQLHWVIVLVNQRYDWLNDFPMQLVELNEHVTDVYGVGNEYKIHHYVKDNIVQEGKAFLRVPYDTLFPTNLFKINDFLLSASAKARVVDIDITNSRLTLLLNKGKFDDSETVGVWGFRENEFTGEIEYKNAFSFTTESFGGTVVNSSNTEPFTSSITGVSELLTIGETLTRLSGSGSFGTNPRITNIISIGESYTLNLLADSAASNGAINFSASNTNFCFTLFDGYRMVTNFDHETEINESKRRIKIVSPEVIPQIIQQLNDILA